MQPHVVYCSVCKVVDETHFVRDLIMANAESDRTNNIC